MGVDFSPVLKNYSGIKTFRFWCQKVLPLVYDDSLSYYELLCKVVTYINNLIEDGQKMGENIDDLLTAYNELQEYVNSYFDNLDIENDIRDIIVEMKNNGEFDYLIGDAKDFDNLPDYIYIDNLIDKSFSDIYALFDEYVNDGILEKNIVGHGSAAIPDVNTAEYADEDISYPIYMYSYKSKAKNIINRTNNTTILISACIHGNEKTGIPVMLTILEKIKSGTDKYINNITDKFNIDFIPCLNPWGVNAAIGTTIENYTSYNGRCNARGVNLNRNAQYCWGSAALNTGTVDYKGPVPISEAETVILETLFEDNKYAYYIELHGTERNCLFFVDSDDEFIKNSAVETINSMYKHIGDLGIDVDDYYLQDGGTYRKILANATNASFPMNDFVHKKESLHRGGIIEFAKAMFDENYPPLGFHTPILQRLSCEIGITIISKTCDYLYEFIKYNYYEDMRASNQVDNLLPMDNSKWINKGINADGTLTSYEVSNRLTTINTIPVKAKTVYTLGISSLFNNVINLHYYNDDGEHTFYAFSKENRSVAFEKAGYVRPVIRGSDNTKFIQKQRIGISLIPWFDENSVGFSTKVFQVSTSAPANTIELLDAVADIQHNIISYVIRFSINYKSANFPSNQFTPIIRLPFDTPFDTQFQFISQNGNLYLLRIFADSNVLRIKPVQDYSSVQLTIGVNFSAAIKSFRLSEESEDSGGEIYNPDE